MSKRIVVLGGGSGGTMVANRLARELDQQIRAGEVELLQIANMEKHIYQPGYIFITFNERKPEHFVRQQKRLVHRNIKLVFDNITKIDPDKNLLISAEHEYTYDYLVISTGSVPNFNSVPGLAEASHNFYTMDGAIRLRDALDKFEKGKVLITVDVPHKCPAAPVEITLMLEDYFRKKGIREQVEIEYAYPVERVHLLPTTAVWIQDQFDKRDIHYVTSFKMAKVDPEKQIVHGKDGSEHPYDLLISIPSHTGAQVILDSQLGDNNGFIPTDRYTLKMEGYDNVYVVGDATNLPISKAGSTAHYESETVVPNIVSRIEGRPESKRYNGKVACFLESGMDASSIINFDYNNPPYPLPPSELLHWFKAVYNEVYWLNARGIM